MRIEKSVFISYRRTTRDTARSVFMALRSKGYDVFFDYLSLDSGSFERTILGEIRARAHFLVILTPDTLIRCSEPGDWVRREIELAIETGRNIIPLTFDGFDWKTAQPHLTGKLAQLSAYQALNVPPDFFDEAMDRLSGPRYLSRPLELVLLPTPPAQQAAVQQQIAAAVSAAPVKPSLTAGDYITRGIALRNQGDYDGALVEYTEALALNPASAIAWYNRGLARRAKGDNDGAISEYSEAIRLDPKYVAAWNNRGYARNDKGDHDGAIRDYSEAIRLDPKLAFAWNNRGVARYNKRDYDGAISDYSEAIRLDPKYVNAWNNRGNARKAKRDYDGAISDTSEAIRLDPKYAIAWNNRANAREAKGDKAGAASDRAEAKRLGYKP